MKQPQHLSLEEYYRMGELVTHLRKPTTKRDRELLKHFSQFLTESQRRIQQLVRPITGYNSKQFKQLLQRCKKSLYVMHFGVMCRLLGVHPFRRRKVEDLILKNRWSRVDLGNYLKANQHLTKSTRGETGRYCKVYTDPIELRASIQAKVSAWVRRHASFLDANKKAFSKLPADFRKQCQKIITQMKKIPQPQRP